MRFGSTQCWWMRILPDCKFKLNIDPLRPIAADKRGSNPVVLLRTLDLTHHQHPTFVSIGMGTAGLLPLFKSNIWRVLKCFYLIIGGVADSELPPNQATSSSRDPKSLSSYPKVQLKSQNFSWYFVQLWILYDTRSVTFDHRKIIITWNKIN